jgi:hypothetical protein
MGDPDPVGTVRRASLDPAAEESIVAGNASRLLSSTRATARGAR